MSVFWHPQLTTTWHSQQAEPTSAASPLKKKSVPPNHLSMTDSKFQLEEKKQNLQTLKSQIGILKRKANRRSCVIGLGASCLYPMTFYARCAACSLLICSSVFCPCLTKPLETCNLGFIEHSSLPPKSTAGIALAIFNANNACDCCNEAEHYLLEKESEALAAAEKAKATCEAEIGTLQLKINTEDSPQIVNPQLEK